MSKKIVIERVENLLILDSKFEEVLQPLLQFWEFKQYRGRELFEYHAQQRAAGILRPKNFRNIRKKLYKISQDKLVCPGNLISRVYTNLVSNGYQVEYKDHRNLVIPEPDFSKVQLLRGDQPDILAKISARDCGIIDYPTGAGKSFLMGEIAAMYPQLPIIVSCPTCAIFKTLIKYFSERGLRPGCCGDSKFDIENKRIIISTVQSLPKLGKLLETVPLFLYDEAYTAASPKNAEHISMIKNARMFAFADKPFARNDGRNLIVESLFGPLIHTSTYQDAVESGSVSQINVLLCNVSDKAKPQSLHNHRDDINKRNCYWANDIRNKAIADSVDVGLNFLNLKLEDCQILIMVETAEHALNLKHLLPNFTVCHSGNLDKDRKEIFSKRNFDKDSIELTPKELSEKQKAFEEGSLKHVIATKIWSAGVNFTKLQIEIRGDALVSEVPNVQLPGRLARLGKPKLLIDFTDRFSEWSEKRADKRISFYRKRGWPVSVHQELLPIRE